MFSYTGEGLPLNVPPPILENINHTNVSYIPSSSVGSLNMAPFSNFQRPNNHYAALSAPTDTLQNVPGIARNIQNAAHPAAYRNQPDTSELPAKPNYDPLNLRIPGSNTNAADRYRHHNAPSFGSKQNPSPECEANFEQPYVEIITPDVKGTAKSETNGNREIDLVNHKKNDVIDINATEAPSWTDVDYQNPFVKDPHGFTEASVDVSQYKIVVGIDNCLSTTETGTAGSPKKTLYRCEQCSLLFAHAKRYLVHCKWHTFGRVNGRRRRLMEEKEQRRLAKMRVPDKSTEIKDGGFPCHVCGSVWENLRRLTTHRLKAHPELPKLCRLCNTEHATSEELTEHMRSCHQDASGEMERFRCDDCDKTFTGYHSLMRHRAVHLEKKFPCDQCEKRFGSQQKLNLHLKTHTRHLTAKEYHCSYCGKSFRESYSLSVHEKVHRGELQFVCDICHSSYATSSSLKRHLRVSHSEAKPFTCLVCRRSFISEKILQRHALGAHAPGTAKRVRRRNKKTPAE